jgi:glutathione S-transferase
MPDNITLFYSPGACSRVPLNALEEMGLPFEEHALALMRGEQKSPDYLAINPKGKVPALKVGDQVLTENPAILYYLATAWPGAQLLPGLDDPVQRAQGLADLVWCGSTLHPLVRQAVMPQLFTSEDPAGVRQFAHRAFEPIAAQLEARLSGERWWYGKTWSIMDVYLAWLVGLAQMGGVPGASTPALKSHTERVRARPSFQRSLAREQAAVERHAIPLPPGAKL